jgi:hypothetical protein
MPAQQRFGPDDQPTPGRAGQQPRESSQHRPVGPVHPRPGHLAPQHVELVAQHHDLDILGMLALHAPEQHTDESACHEVEKGQGHRPIIPCPILAAQRIRPGF